MKTQKIACLIVLLAVGTAGYALAAGAENQLLRNSSFKNIRDDRPAAWRATPFGGNADLKIASMGHDDSASVMISSAEGADASWSQEVAATPFAKYRLSGWIKTENLTATTGQGALFNIHGMDEFHTKALTGTNDWTKVECEFTIEDSDSLQVNCLFGGWGMATGKAWFDDVELTLLETQKPKSGTQTMDIQIDASKSFEPISKYIYGQFLEHLGQCIYGGIWAEMLEDRKFYFDVPAKKAAWTTIGSGARVLRDSPWKVIGPAEAVKMTSENPLSGKHSPQITVAGNTAGISQDELALIKGKDYTGRVVLRGDNSACPIQVSLVWAEGQAGRQTITIKKLSKDYKSYDLKFKAGAATGNARLEITGTGKGSFVIGTASLMPGDNVKGFRSDTLALLKELDSPLYRWPGGNFVSGYDWRDGLGERDRRPTRSNPAWTGIETNDVGMHEFIELCRLLNADPMIAINAGFGDAYSAADEVEYANGATDTRMGKWRADNGSKEPFKIKWWCVGNEMWGDWQLGYMKLDHFVIKHNWIEEKMRKVDPTIVTIGSGDLGGGWSESLLKNCANNMNLISEHFYCQTRPGLTSHVQWMPEQIKTKTDAHRKYRESIPGLKEKDIRIAMDEWNYWYGPHVFGELGTRYFMKDALGIAAGLHEFFRNSDIVFMANYAQTVNVIGCIKTTKTEAFFDSTGMPLVLYRREFGTIPVSVTGWNEKLDVSAALTEDKKFLTLGFVNATYDTYEVTPAIKGLSVKGKIQGWIITNPDPMAYNDPGKLNVNIEPLPAVESIQKISIKPVSITVLKIPVK
jgi:alpha-N-arabinofuranosidase